MADSWGMTEHPVERHPRPLGEDGEVVLGRPNGSFGGPVHAENYSATDGRHDRPDHAGWASIDGNSGEDVGEDGEAHGRFEDGPGVWRQT